MENGNTIHEYLSSSFNSKTEIFKRRRYDNSTEMQSQNKTHDHTFTNKTTTDMEVEVV